MKIIAGNWKMNKTVYETIDFCEKLFFDLPNIVILFPPATALQAAHDILQGSRILIGAQNMHYEDKGAFTGEISPRMVKELCTHVLVGHSERRHIFNETEEVIAKKMIAAKRFGLIPLLCIGETKEERDSNRTREVLARQLTSALDCLKDLDLIIAYEPVWAIGSDNNDSPEDAQAMHRFIKDTIKGRYKNEKIPVIYGGTVKQDNIASLITMPDIDGCLIGRGSLDIDSFQEMARLK